MATEAQITSLRIKIGEPIPADGTEADTMFTDATLGGLIDSTASIAGAAVLGWEAKLAQWASLVDITDGASMRALSDLTEHGEARLAYYKKDSLGPVRSRSRVGKIVRS